MIDEGQQPDAEPSSAWKPGDRIWLLPDTDKREVKSPQPGLVLSVIAHSGRVRVVYIEHGCKLTKTVEPKRIKARDLICRELKERA